MTYNLDELVKLLDHQDPVERRYAAEDLGELADPKAIQALIKALDDPDKSVREAAADALIAIGGKEVAEAVIPLLYSEVVHQRNYATEILSQLGDEAIPYLLQECSSPNVDVRKFVIDILGQIGEVHRISDLSQLINLLNDKDINVAAAAAEALGRISDPSVVPILAQHLSGPSWMQCNVIHAIAEIGGKQASEVLKSLDRDKLSKEAQYYYDMALKRIQEGTEEEPKHDFDATTQLI
ncbi:MAG: HEAT repeat domain-containing protein [candidate division KSB1 bacterium]|nr:HEAT repeat domain-containing protein [candidate division KSB1 bacterium]MDQ7065943.1 HEAT repeat domain-containing protein [candidate division KSB1 bacterium]